MFSFICYVQQWRLFPYLAAACVLKISVTSLTDVYLAIVEKSRANSNGFEELVCNIRMLNFGKSIEFCLKLYAFHCF